MIFTFSPRVGNISLAVIHFPPCLSALIRNLPRLIKRSHLLFPPLPPSQSRPPSSPPPPPPAPTTTILIWFTLNIEPRFVGALAFGQNQDRRDTFGAVWPTATIQTSAICANIPWICADLCICVNILCICVNIRNLFRAAPERFVKEIWRYKWPAPPSSSNSSSCVNGRKNPVAAPERFSSGNFVFSSLIAWPCPSLRGAQNIYQVGFI